MLTVNITTKDGNEITIKNIDSLYYTEEDETYRLFNDLNDMTLSSTKPIDDIEIDGDTIYVPISIISLISIR